MSFVRVVYWSQLHSYSEQWVPRRLRDEWGTSENEIVLRTVGSRKDRGMSEDDPTYLWGKGTWRKMGRVRNWTGLFVYTTGTRGGGRRTQRTGMLQTNTIRGLLGSRETVQNVFEVRMRNSGEFLVSSLYVTTSLFLAGPLSVLSTASDTTPSPCQGIG